VTAFRYVAYTARGRRRTGTLVADTRAQASEQLRKDGLFVTEITARAQASARPWIAFHGRRGVGPEERAVFTRQLEVLLSAEVAVDVALDNIANAGGSQRVRALATEACGALREGSSLADALAQADGAFPPYYLAAVAAGESSGELARVVGELADHLETVSGDRARLATALIYPAFVAAVSLVVCAILVTSVAPQIVTMFEATGRPLPGITLALLAVSDWLQAWWSALLAALAGTVLAARAAMRRPRVRDTVDRGLLRLPVIGRLIRLSAALQYLQTLALVTSSRQTAVDAVASAARVLTQQHYQAEAAQVTQAIQRGESLSMAMRHLSMIPPVCRQLISAGEQSARVGRMTERASRLVDTWLENDRKRLAALLDPLLMMVVGGFVLVVVLAILLPIFDLQAMVSETP
jgi:general secretion pathway protein F